MLKKVDLICHSKDGLSGGCVRLPQWFCMVRDNAKVIHNVKKKSKEDVSMNVDAIL